MEGVGAPCLGAVFRHLGRYYYCMNKGVVFAVMVSCLGVVSRPDHNLQSLFAQNTCHALL